MLLRRVLKVTLSSPSCSRLVSSTSPCFWQNYENERHYEPGEEPIKRTWHGLSYDFRRWARRYNEARKDAWQRKHPIAHMKSAIQDYELLPYRAEILIIGSSMAYWIKQRFRDEDFKVVVLENNDKFEQSSTMLSTGGLSPQHELPENIEMSLFTAEFLRHAGEHLRILDSDPPDINFYPCPYLHLACSEESAEKMREVWKIQTEKGARIQLLTREQLREQFPAVNFDDVVLGSVALENEGVFDTWQLLAALREKNLTLGVQYVKAEVEEFLFEPSRILPEAHAYETGAIADEIAEQTKRILGVIARPQMTDASARPVRAGQIINCAGPWAGEVAKLMGAGKGAHLLAVPVPIAPRKRTRFVLHAPDAPVDLPMMVLPSGVWLRQDRPGHGFIAGKHMSSQEDAAIDHSNLDVDYDLFYNVIWPQLVQRAPSLQTAKQQGIILDRYGCSDHLGRATAGISPPDKAIQPRHCRRVVVQLYHGLPPGFIKSAWASYESVNTFDGAPLIGEHLHHKNVYTVGGLGHRDAQHALAVGRAFAERLFDGAYVSINLRSLDMRRIMNKEPMHDHLWP